MPQQELFFEHTAGDWRVEVVKTYDRSYARETFDAMDDAARAHLWNALRIDVNHEAEDIPPRDTPDGEDFLWDELLDSAREDGNQLSFFVVNDSEASGSLYVSPDWPSAEDFARSRIAAAQ
jgi:hypothetical protein